MQYENCSAWLHSKDSKGVSVTHDKISASISITTTLQYWLSKIKPTRCLQINPKHFRQVAAFKGICPDCLYRKLATAIKPFRIHARKHLWHYTIVVPFTLPYHSNHSRFFAISMPSIYGHTL